MVEEFPLVQIPKILKYIHAIELTSLIILIIFGLVLFILSKKIKSKSLKIGILIPLISFIIGIISWSFFDFGGYILILLFFGGIPISLLSILFSVIAFFKLEKKTLPILSLIYGILYGATSLIIILNFRGM